ncbi:MAG: acetoin utilization protein AcuC [Bacteroidota bacterium]
MTPVVYHPAYLTYQFGETHPFSPVRQEMLTSLIQALGLPWAPTAPAPATDAALLRVHAAALLDQVAAASQGAATAEAKRFGLGTMDVPVFAGMDEAARWLVGGTLHAAHLVADGPARRVLQLGGGLHHAQRTLASGFCVYNDLSVAIQALRDRGLRVAYIDIDVHHGDGVQALHYADPDVLTISLHESGRYLFPGTGRVHELGEGAGHGFSINAPLEPRTGHDSFLAVFETVVPEALGWFRPDVLVIQCGADAHYRDPLADLILTTHTYEVLFRRLLEVADEHASGRALFTLGGGYDPDAAVRVWLILYLLLHEQPLPRDLPEAWYEHWAPQLEDGLSRTLHDARRTFEVDDAEAIDRHNRQVSQRLMETAVRYWY